MRLMMFLATALAAAPVMAADPATGRETVITFAANGGLRHWTPGAPGSGIVYVRDRTERWYQIRLTGPCVQDRALDTLTYTTDNAGTFDRFSRVSVARYPGRVCGVTSIRASAAPPGEPGAPRPRR